MNFESFLYPTYFIMSPVMLVSQPFFAQELDVPEEESTREQPRKFDLQNCERDFRAFFKAVLLASPTETRLDW